MRKIVHLLVFCILILGMIQVIIPFDNLTTIATTPSPRDDVDGAYVQYLFGDWNVTGDESYTDEIFVLTGNLTILSGGSLTLRNCTLAINCSTENGTYDIQVMDGGALNITDGDNDPATTNDRSNITDSPFDTDDYGEFDYRYSIKAWQGSSISIENSIIREAGFPFVSDAYGLYLYTDNVNIQNCTIERNWYGLYLNRGTNHRIAYNMIRYCNEYAVYNAWSTYLQFYNNLIYHNENGVYLSSSYSNIYNNIIHNNSNAISKSTMWQKRGLTIWYADYSKIFNNTIKDHGGASSCNNVNIYGCDYSQMYDNKILDGTSGIWSIEIVGLSNFDFYNNTITNNEGSTLYYGVAGTPANNVRIFNNNISNNKGTALRVSGYGSATTTVEVKNNKLYNNNGGIQLRELRTYDIQNNIIMNCSGYAVYVNDVAGGEFSNNTVNSTGDDFQLRDQYGPNDDTVFEVVNCTCDPSKTTIFDGKPKLVILNFLHLNVTDNNSKVPGASITIRNNTGVIVFTGETDENGSIEFIKIKNQTVDSKGAIYFDPHNISAALDIFTAYGEIEPTMNRSQTVNVHFNIDLPPLPARELVAEGDGTNVNLNWEPSPSKDTIHYLVYRNGTGSSWILVYNSSLYPLKELWTNWTDIQGASTPSTYSYKVVAVDHLWQQSEDSNIAFCGDWVVDNVRIINDLNVQLNGSLTVLPTGNLTINNCKIQFNNSFNGEYGIEVAIGGKLTILDSDNNPQTTTDQSVISALNPNYNLFFQVTSSEFIMKNSKLTNCGFDERVIIEDWDMITALSVLAMGEPKNRGLYIQDSVVTIESNEISNNFVSILIDETRNGIVYDNTFFDNSFGIFLNRSNQLILNDNSFSNHAGFPIYLLNSENNQVYSNIITNPSSTTAGIGVYDGGCIDNEIFSNDLISGEAGVYILNAGNNNNVSNNNFDGQDIGIYIISTSWNTLLNNNFNDTSNSSCYLWNSHYNTIIGGASVWSYYGYFFHFSSNIEISNVNVKNSIYSAVSTYDSGNIAMRNLQIDGSNFGLHLRNGGTISLTNISISNCTAGIYTYNIKTDTYLIDSQMQVGIVNAIVANNCDWIEITNCTFDASQYNFNLIYSNAVLFNTTYNQNRVLLDPSSGIALLWPVDVQVIDWWGNPASNTNLQVRKVMGTIIYNGYTDGKGWVRWLWLLERIQFSHSNDSSTPHIFKGISSNHLGETTLLLNQSTSITVYLENEMPSVSNIAIHPPYPDTTANLKLEYQYSDAELDSETGTSIRWNVSGEFNSTFDGFTEITSEYTRKGQTWFCEIIPYDGATYGLPMTSMPVTIQNTPPEVSNVIIEEISPTSSDDMHVAYTYFDLDNDPETRSEHKWFVNDGTGWGYSGQDTMVLSASITKKGERWKCEVTPSDGDDDGATIETPEVIIDNTPPAVSNLTILPTNPRSNQTIYASYKYFDLDSDAEEGSVITWFRNGEEQDDLSGSLSIDTERTTKGDEWQYKIIPHDGDDFGIEGYSEIIRIGNTPPIASNITLHPDKPSTNDDLFVEYDFYDNDGDQEGDETNIKWLRWSGIAFIDSGYRGKILPSSATIKNQVWTCEITPHDNFNHGSVVKTSKSVTIVNSPPIVSEVQLTPGHPTTSSDLKATYSYFDSDNDPDTNTEIMWYMNGLQKSEFNNKLIIPNTATKKGDTWYFSVRPNDGQNYGTKLESERIIIQNSLPIARNLTISPGEPLSDDELNASYIFYDEDGDNESAPEIRWYRNGLPESKYNNKLIVDSDATRKSEIWYFTIRVNDTLDFGEIITSHYVVIGNSEAIITALYPTLGKVTINETESLEFFIHAVDPDGDHLLYRWKLDKNTVSDDEYYLFETNYESAGTYNLTVTVQDVAAGSSFVTFAWEVNVKNENRQPQLTVIEPKAKDLKMKEELSLKFIISESDPDKDDTLTINWDVDGSEVQSGIGLNTYLAEKKYLKTGDHVVEVEVLDNYGESVKYSWNLTVIDIESEKEVEGMFGLNWDQLGLLVEAIVVIFTAIFAAIGIIKLRKKRSKLKEYMDQIDEIMDKDESVRDKETELIDLKKQIKDEFSQGLITENHYMILEREVDNALGDTRKAIIDERVVMPEALKEDVSEVLEDGMVTKEEYRNVVEKIRASDALTEAEKLKLNSLMAKWMQDDRRREI